MAVERCFACNGDGPGRCYVDRHEVFSVHAAARGVFLGAIVGAMLGGPAGLFWGGGISAALNGLFGDAIDRKLRA